MNAEPFTADRIKDPRGRELAKPWGVYETLCEGGRALRARHYTQAAAEAEAAACNTARRKAA